MLIIRTYVLTNVLTFDLLICFRSDRREQTTRRNPRGGD